MCGIVGLIDLALKHGAEHCRGVVMRMSDALRHRGPDDAGLWVDEGAGVAMGHRRLAVIDLSEHGRQPMISADGRYVIVFNGEVYNYREVRKTLEQEGAASPWRGHSDTEVMLAAISRWGVEEAIRGFNGMFAFALWDRQERILYLARDRLGEKPVYFGWASDTFLFSSELKAMRAHPAWSGGIDRRALSLFFRWNYIPSPLSIYEGIYKLPAGRLLALPLDTLMRERSYEGVIKGMRTFWSAGEVAAQGVARRFQGPEGEAIEELDRILRAAVGLRMEADVPLGAFLSGGIDSSTIVAMMQQVSTRPVKTFTVGFPEEARDEAEQARAVAAHLGTEHTELYVTPDQAMEAIPKLPFLYDEPFSDSSQIPTYLVAELARKHVTVSLSGDGGDELFFGYKRYQAARSLWGMVGWMPRAGRTVLSTLLCYVPLRILDRAFGWMRPLLDVYAEPGMVGDKLRKIGEFLPVDRPEALYSRMMSQWLGPEPLVIDAPQNPMDQSGIPVPRGLPFPESLMYQDQVGYLPDDILVKVDRASMGVSLEARVPFLDHRVVEFSWRLPLSMKIREGKGKWIVRQLLKRYLPAGWVDRPKMGFAPPIEGWIRGPLREWCEELLDEGRLRREGYLRPSHVRQRWEEHLSGRRNWQHPLWAVLMFQAWLEQQPGEGQRSDVTTVGTSA